MIRLLKRVHVAIALATTFAVIPMGCATSFDQKRAVAEYQAEQLACVDQSSTLAESRACRAKVKEKWRPIWEKEGVQP